MKRKEDLEKAKADEAWAGNEARKAGAESLRALSVHARIEDVRKQAGQLLGIRIKDDHLLDPMVATNQDLSVPISQDTLGTTSTELATD